MYNLTLSAGERQALDWVGGRYPHGHDLYRLLWGACQPAGNELDWDSSHDIAFRIPEHVAWQIAAMSEECEHRWDCFAPALAAKLEELCGKIV